MTGDLLGFTFTEPEPAPPSGNADRFGGRWRLIGAWRLNVWRYGDLDLAAPSGRLLMRGPNGTGKTTALEALWPYLLDLNAAKLGAWKARPTSLKLLMSEGATRNAATTVHVLAVRRQQRKPGRARCGSRRLRQYSENGSPAVTVIPFIMPGPPRAAARRAPHCFRAGRVHHPHHRRRRTNLRRRRRLRRPSRCQGSRRPAPTSCACWRASCARYATPPSSGTCQPRTPRPPSGPRCPESPNKS